MTAARRGASGTAGRALRWGAAVLVAGLVPALTPAAADAQRLPDLRPPAADTVPGDTVRPRAVPSDTVPADTLRTARERALERLRALPATPIQRDTTAPADTAADDADGEEGEIEVVIETESGERLAWTADTMDVTLDEEAVRSLLLNLRGYVATEYSGDSAVFERTGNRLNLMGEGRVAREGAAMETDSMLVYTGDTGIVCGFGNPILSGDEGDPIQSERVCYDIHRRIGMADRATTQFVQGGTWYVRGPENRIFVLNQPDENRLYGHKTQFTSCDLPEPHYAFQARSLKVVQNDVMVARDVTLRFGDVPVFWLPWLVQSMKPDRRSGLLTPQFGVNDIVRNSTGYNRRISNVGFYWAASDYVSALVAGEWFSNNYTALEGSLTYAWLRQFLRGRVAVKQYWQYGEFGVGRRDLSVSTNNSWRPDERTSVRVQGDYITSTALVQDYSFDPGELNRQIFSSAGVDRSFGWGSTSLSAERRQQITDDQVNWRLPSLSVSVRPLTLFAGEDGLGGLTVSGSGNVNRSLREVNHDLTPQARGHETVNAGAGHSISWGRLSLSQNVQFRDQTDAARPFSTGANGIVPALPQTDEQELGWNTSLGFQQTLWPGTTLSPSLSIQGRQIRGDTTGGVFVAAPNRIAAGASLGTTLFGFWPGFGEYERIRHKISPTLNWSYSPEPSPSPLQETVFGLQNLREQNRLGLSFNQTFEAKVREDRADRTAPRNGEVAEDVGAADAVDAAEVAELAQAADAAAAADVGLDGEDGEPRRLPPSRTVNLLSINTNTTFQYDFVEAREGGRGFLTEEISNSLRSDLVPGFQLAMTHSLFEKGEAEDGGVEPRTFRPFLTQLSASFSIDPDFWLVRMLGLGGGDAGRDEHGHDRGREGVIPDGTGPFDLDHRDPGSGAMMPGAGGNMAAGMAGAPRSGWRATVSYSLNRPRPSPAALQGQGLSGQGLGRQEQQTVNGTLGFRPTEHWSVNWRTSYSFTTGEFDSHVLTLARDLHRWQANFDFIKSPNGNFSMQFRVHLLDNPDLKVEYDQRTDPSDRLRMSQDQ